MVQQFTIIVILEQLYHKAFFSQMLHFQLRPQHCFFCDCCRNCSQICSHSHLHEELFVKKRRKGLSLRVYQNVWSALFYFSLQTTVLSKVPENDCFLSQMEGFRFDKKKCKDVRM